MKGADMQTVFEKIIEELEKNASRYTKKYVTPYGNNGYRDTKAISVNKAIEIVKQEAEQYNNAIIDGKYCFQSCACTEKCDKCSRLRNGDIDWYENIDNLT